MTTTTTTTPPANGRTTRGKKTPRFPGNGRSAGSMKPSPRTVAAGGDERLVVKESPIHGLGLFAKKRIRKGAIIGKIEGVLSRQDGPHVLWIADAYGIEVTNEMRYINHSDQPNACYYDDATVVALRAIQPGEEITHNYDGDS